MRLIDADDLPVHRGIDVGGNYGGLRAVVFKRDIDKATTIDAVPVKPGKWSAYDVSGYRKCSMCGGYVNWNPKPFLFGEGEYNYCPNCGAKMDGERRDYG